jgi:hypothetical protein
MSDGTRCQANQVVSVDVENPFFNGSLYITKFGNRKGTSARRNGTKQLEGFSLVKYFSDQRDLKFYNLYIVRQGESSCVLLEEPIAEHGLMNNPEEFFRETVDFDNGDSKVWCESTLDAHMVNITKIKKKGLTVKKTLFVFPSGIKLSNEHLSGDTLNNKVQMKCEPKDMGDGDCHYAIWWQVTSKAVDMEIDEDDGVAEITYRLAKLKALRGRGTQNMD